MTKIDWLPEQLKRSNDGHILRPLVCSDCGETHWVRPNSRKTDLCYRCSSALNGRRFHKTHSGKLSPSWNGGKVARVCKQCKHIFYVYPALVRYGYGGFCSHSCKMDYQHRHGGFNYRSRPTKPERLVMRLLEEAKLPFKYVGDGKVWLGKCNPDFINYNGKKQVIEVFGVYWHPIFDVAQRMEAFRQYGFNTLIIWQDELVNERLVLKKLKKFARS